MLPGVGPALAKKLIQCGIQTIQDLLFHIPFRYQDRTRITPIQDLQRNDWCVIYGRICKIEVKQGKKPMLYCYVEDKTGILRLRFFHFHRQQMLQFQNRPWVYAFGEVRQFQSQWEMVHPEYKLYETTAPLHIEETYTPIYSTTQGLSQTRLRQLVRSALELYEAQLQQLEWMSASQLQHYRLYAFPDALKTLHQPSPDIALSALEQGQHPGLKRLIFDELVAQRVSLSIVKQQRQALKAPILLVEQTVMRRFIESLPFHLTQAQARVQQEVATDLQRNYPMLRLVQGDVGSGKTVIAALAAIQALAQGFQVAFMAPTELLSEQHTATLSQWLAPLGFRTQMLRSKMKKRTQVIQAIAHHDIDLIVGTHALFQDSIQFARLGLVIIDEQHRFGVEQRVQLWQKGQIADQVPHQLLMTATPIPRTLAMTQYAHLDLSIIDELPPNRTPVNTVVLNQTKRDLVIARLKTALQQQRQVYWVCTLIEESEKLQCMAALATTEYLKTQLPNVRIGLVHGRLSSLEKEQTMQAFKSGEMDLLVATTVIEVGVDVPNASVMIIENAERLGLAQLHQLRGRVGRGSTQSFCLLLYQPPLSRIGQERLQMMRETCDGFVIAEKDLQLRGAGNILGTQQAGYRSLKMMQQVPDMALLSEIGHVAYALLKDSPQLASTIAQRWLGEFENYTKS